MSNSEAIWNVITKQQLKCFSEEECFSTEKWLLLKRKKTNNKIDPGLQLFYIESEKMNLVNLICINLFNSKVLVLEIFLIVVRQNKISGARAQSEKKWNRKVAC